MPPEGVPLQKESQLLSRGELETLVSIFVKHGVDKVRLTGGEPLLRKDLVDIVRDVSRLDKITQIGMTTNGITLQRHLPQLVEAGLTHVNISLDTLQPHVFLDLTRRQGLDKVLTSIQVAKSLLPQPGRVKINCVVMKNINDTELNEFINLGKNLNVDVRFIEYMPFSSNGWNQNRFVSYKDMLLQSLQSCDLQRIQDGPNDTTKWYSNSSTTNNSARVGFITSMSQHFCGTCNRLRLTADGKLKACLFGASEISLRDALRNGASLDDLEKIIHYALSQKSYSLGGHASAQAIANNAHDNRPMTLIGG
jgi:cyclic pyranopterin phosphate synthase